MISSIRDYLSSDTLSSTPCTVVMNNPTYFQTIVQVPDYSWKSLSSLLLGSDQASSVLSQSINDKPGEAKDDAESEVTILFMPQESNLVNYGIPDNIQGSESSFMDIYIRFQEGETVERVINTEMRIRYLLDHGWRSKRRAASGPFVPKMNDKTIDNRLFDIYCAWRGWLVPPNSRECAVRYVISYSRIYTK